MAVEQRLVHSPGEACLPPGFETGALLIVDVDEEAEAEDNLMMLYTNPENGFMKAIFICNLEICP